MNKFLQMTTKAIMRNGMSLVYTEVNPGVYDPTTSKTVNQTVNHTLTIFPKSMTATVYSYPTLVGKSTYMFYVSAENLGFVPKPLDYVTYLGKKYQVHSVQSFVGGSEVCMYRMVGYSG